MAAPPSCGLHVPASADPGPATLDLAGARCHHVDPAWASRPKSVCAGAKEGIPAGIHLCPAGSQAAGKQLCQGGWTARCP